MRQTIILPIGAPCSGKSDVGTIIEKNFGAYVLSTKGLLEEHRKDTSDTIINAGVVDDDIMIPLLEKHWPYHENVVFLDSLRSVGQVRWVQKRFGHKVKSIIGLHLLADEKEIFKRRENAPNTSRGTRPDDTKAKLKKRLVAYELYSPPMFPAIRQVSHSFEEIDTNKNLSLVGGHVVAFCVKSGLSFAQREASLSDPFAHAQYA